MDNSNGCYLDKKFVPVSFSLIFGAFRLKNPMQINTELLKNKQRILIGGNKGASEIYEIVKNVLKHIDKPVDFASLEEEFTPGDAPVIIFKGGDQLIDNEALFQQLGVHILLVHQVTETPPADYKNFEQYIGQLEKLADSLPKAGTFIYFEEDNVATMMGKKDRTDVKPIEYSRLKSKKTNDGIQLMLDEYKATVKTENDNFPAYAAGAKALLNRIGVSDNQFFSGLKTL